MTLFAFSTTVPTTGHLPSIDYTTMAANNVSTAGIMAVDHNGFNVNNGGYHNLIHLDSQTPSSSRIGKLQELDVGSDSQLFHTSNNGVVTQLTGPTAPSASTIGYVYLSGGILLQWGFTAIPNSPSATGLVNFPIAFPNASFIVNTALVSKVGGTGSSSDAIAVRQGSNSTTQFRWDWNGNAGSYTFFNWIAIGN